MTSHSHIYQSNIIHEKVTQDIYGIPIESQ